MTAMSANASDAGPTFPGSVVVEGVMCYTREDEPGTWWYVPGDPLPEMAGGRPAVQLWVSPPGSVLQLGADWTVSADLLARLQRRLAQADGTERVGLQPAPAAVRQVALEIGNEQGGRDVVALSPSSGFPPFRAIFRANLDAVGTNSAIAAINGRRGLVFIRYRVAAPLKASARARLEGDAGAAADQLGPAASSAEVRAWVDEAIAAERLTLTRQRSGPADDALEQRARALCIDKFTMLLEQTLRARQGATDPGTPVSARSTLAAEASVSAIVQQEFDRAADVGTWIPAGESAAHITVLPGRGGADPSPPAARVAVGLGFRAADLPVAFVEARCGEQKVVLRAPRFEPAALDSARCDGGVVVTTHFTTGAPPFRAEVSPAAAERLPPAALGLTEIVVDGRERQQAGAREIRVRLQFRPAGGEPGEDRTFYLRDDAWVASFFLVTGGAPVAGEWRLDWREKTRDAQERRHRVTANDQAVFVLREAEPDPGVNP